MSYEDATPTYSIGELADLIGVSRRTVRYYVQLKLIEPPTGLGRGSAYTGKHAEQIQRVLRLQREGLSLQAIQQLPPGQEPAPMPTCGMPTMVLRIPVVKGIRLEVDVGSSLPSPQAIDALAKACSNILGSEGVGSAQSGAAKDEGEEGNHE